MIIHHYWCMYSRIQSGIRNDTSFSKGAFAKFSVIQKREFIAKGGGGVTEYVK